MEFSIELQKEVAAQRADKTVSAGRKFDGEKARYDLYPSDAYECCTKVLTFGAKKYADNEWKTVPNGVNRYYAAMIRHMLAQKEHIDRGGKGLLLDEESGLPHLDHAQCCLIFMRHITNKEKLEVKGQE